MKKQRLKKTPKISMGLHPVSAFGKWFEEQFGKAPHQPKSLTDLRHAVAKLGAAKADALAELEARELWEARRDAALLGWAARDYP